MFTGDKEKIMSEKEKVRTYASMNKDKNNGVHMCQTIQKMFNLGTQYFDKESLEGVKGLYTLDEYASTEKKVKHEIS